MVFISLIFSGGLVCAETIGVSFLLPLKLGDSGPAVLALQKILNSDPDTRIAFSGNGAPGMETDYFGLKTKNAVVRFQEKYGADILAPAGLKNGTGYVGQKTIEKLNSFASATTNFASKQVLNVQASNPKNYNPTNNSITPSINSTKTKTPIVFSVSPNKVRRGDKVTIVGENFTPTGNTIILGDGPINKTFENLKSSDGKNITFTYEPPVIKTMSKTELASIPPKFLEQIEKPIKEAGLTLDSVMSPYDSIRSEDELKNVLEKNGRTFDEMYHYFFVIVKNSNGNFFSDVALLHGIRNLPYESLANSPSGKLLSLLGDGISSFIQKITPASYAQMKGGGFTTGIIMVCTCSAGMMTFQLDYTGGGTGIYVINPGFRPDAGSGLVSGPWLGGYQIMAGQCMMYSGLACFTIPGNTPMKPVGYAF